MRDNFLTLALLATSGSPKSLGQLYFLCSGLPLELQTSLGSPKLPALKTNQLREDPASIPGEKPVVQVSEVQLVGDVWVIIIRLTLASLGSRQHRLHVLGAGVRLRLFCINQVRLQNSGRRASGSSAIHSLSVPRWRMWRGRDGNLHALIAGEPRRLPQVPIIGTRTRR